MNFRRRAMSLAATAALSLALVPTPVLAAAIDGCAPAAAAAMSCSGVMAPPARRTPASSTRICPRAKGKAPANFSVTVPVWVHVITDGAIGNLTSQQINAQIAVLDDGFDGREAVTIRLLLHACRRDPHGQPGLGLATGRRRARDEEGPEAG